MRRIKVAFDIISKKNKLQEKGWIEENGLSMEPDEWEKLEGVNGVFSSSLGCL